MKGVTFGFWELHTFRSNKGSTNCGILVKLSQIVRFWIFCVTHGSLAFGLWTLRTSRTRGSGSVGYTLIRNLEILCSFVHKSVPGSEFWRRDMRRVVQVGIRELV